MRKARATREELFEADEHSISWADHQQWRIERLMSLESERLGIPSASLRLVFEGRQVLELISREGHTVRYRAEGLIEQINLPRTPAQTMTFEVSWIDPWGFYHSDQSNFFELRLKVVDELSFRRLQRLVFRARDAMKTRLNQ